jgi:hypothetical protein
MKNFVRHRLKFIDRQKIVPVSLLIMLVTYLAVSAAAFVPGFSSEAFAANNSTNYCRTLVGNEQQPPVDANSVPEDNAFVQDCEKGYAAGYQNPKNNDYSATCNSTVSHIAECKSGYQQGQKDKNAESGNSTPTPAQIKAAAEKACQPYKDQDGVSSDDKAKNFKGCVDGYTGQMNGKDRTASCENYSGVSQNACLHGHTAAIDGKPIVPRTADTAPDSTGGTTGSGSGNSTNTKQLDCDTKFSNPLTWVLCPVIDILSGVVDLLDGMITNELSIEGNTIFCNKGSVSDGQQKVCDAYHSAWSKFRNIALGFMVIVGLVIVISQALGLEVLDAYTIRKTLPRLLVAAIFITLSWSLMSFAIDLTNDLGYGVRHLIYAPFAGLPEKIDLNFASGISNTLVGSLTAVVGAGAAIPIWIAAGGIGVLLSYMATAAMAVIIALLVLALRQIAIIFLMLLAPLAIIMYVLPNTQKYYKFWWESFSKALLMFPLIAAFIATGRVFAAVSISRGTPLSQFIAFISYFAPYFLIPLTFRFAGGFVSQLGGFVNDRGRGAFDGLRNYRKKTMADRVSRARGGGLYRDEALGGMGKVLNKFGSYTLDADEQLQYDIGSGTGVGRLTGRAGKALMGRTAQAMGEEINHATAAHTAKAVQDLDMHYSTAWAAAGLTDRFSRDQFENDADYQAVQKFAGENAPKTYGEMLEMSAALSKAKTGSDAAMAGAGLQGVAGRLSSLKLNKETQRATVQSVAMLSAAKDGKLSAAEVADYHNGIHGEETKGKAPKGMAETLMSQIENASTSNRQDLRRGKGIRIDDHGHAYSVFDGEHANSKESVAAVTSMKGPAAANAKADTVRDMTPTYVHMLNGTTEGGPVSQAVLEDTIDTIAYGAYNPYTDPDQRLAWEAVASNPNLDPAMQARVQGRIAEFKRRGPPNAIENQGANPGGPPGPPGQDQLPGMPTGI